MDNFDISQIPPKEDEDITIPFDDKDDSSENTRVSHSPLELGSKATNKPQPRPSVQPVKESVVKESMPVQSSAGRITGVRTFFTKLHAGAITFLDEQIAEWLKKNPNITVKRTNIAIGEVQSKKTEPNIIITVWY